MDKCEHCGWKPLFTRMLNVHHVVALCCGGSETPDNIAVLCPNCHAYAHCVTSRHKRKHLGPDTREALFAALKAPKDYRQPSFSMDELRNVVSLLGR